MQQQENLISKVGVAWGGVLAICVGVAFITASFAGMFYDGKAQATRAAHVKEISNLKRQHTNEKKAIITDVSAKIDRVLSNHECVHNHSGVK